MAVAALRRFPPTADAVEATVARLCAECAPWLTGLLKAIVRGQAEASSLFGLPLGADRALVFPGQCTLCRSLPSTGTAGFECRPLVNSFEGWRRVDLCPACDAWLTSIARDGRSARGNASRLIDGPYGEWPHPNLRFLHVATNVRDEGIATAIRDACAAMGVEVGSPAEVAPGAILFVEVGPGIDQHGMSPGPFAASVAVAPLNGRAQLVEALATGATDWLTAPVTPQQVTAALTRVPARWQHPVEYDPFTALPTIRDLPRERPVLFVEPARGTDLFELVWLLRRHSRGYDDLVSCGASQIAFLPRVRAENVGYIVTRLGMLLDGRCRITERPSYAGYRLDAAG